MQVVAVPDGTAQDALQKYQRNPNVQFAELNYLRPLYRPATNEGSEPGLGIANNFTEQWGLHNTGQSFGVTVDPLFGTLTAPVYTGIADADIDAPEGWPSRMVILLCASPFSTVASPVRTSISIQNALSMLREK